MFTLKPGIFTKSNLIKVKLKKLLWNIIISYTQQTDEIDGSSHRIMLNL